MKWCEHEFQVYMFDIFAPATIMDMPCFGGDGKLCSNSAVGFWSKWCPLIQAGSGVRLELGGKINIEYQEWAICRGCFWVLHGCTLNLLYLLWFMICISAFLFFLHWSKQHYVYSWDRHPTDPIGTGTVYHATLCEGTEAAIKARNHLVKQRLNQEEYENDHG